MARVGVSYPRYAKYQNTNGTVTYDGAKSLGKATTLDLSLNNSDSNILYADNGPAESAREFAGGTLKVGTDDLYDAAAVDILGLLRNELTTPEAAVEIVRKAGQVPPYVGVGCIMKTIRNGATQYVGMIFTKVQFKDPGISLKTQGEKIEWQTPETEGDVLRDDTADQTWNRHATFDTEAKAMAYVDAFLSTGAPAGGGSDTENTPA